MTHPSRLAGVVVCWLASTGAAVAHDGPPYPIATDRQLGPYVLTVWTDPDTTDDATPGGQFWITVSPGTSGTDGTRVTVTATPKGGGAPRTVEARPVEGRGTRFGALRLDREGPFHVDVAVTGPRGDASVRLEVDATYDLRPAPWAAVLYVLPFAAVGALWIKRLLRRHRATPTRAEPVLDARAQGRR